MQIKKASKSSFECFDGCEWQYYLQYIKGIKTPSGKAALLGNICHTVLEILAKFKLSGRIKNRTILNNHKVILDISYKRHQKDNPSISLDQSDYNQCLKWLEKILATDRDPRKLNVLHIEHGFLMEFLRPGFRYEFKDKDATVSGQFCLNGFIDLINIIKENGEDILEIVDYKFGKYSTDWSTGEEKTNENLKKDLQVKCYYLACQELFPQYNKIKISVVYVQLDKTLSCYMTGDDVLSSIDDIRRRFKRIVNCRTPERLIDKKSKSNQHFKCKHVCHFGKTKEPSGISLCESLYRMYQKDNTMIGLTIENRILKSVRKPIENKIFIK